MPYFFRYDSDTYDFIEDGIESLTGIRSEDFSRRAFEGISKETVMLGDIEGMTREEAQRLARSNPKVRWKADYRVKTRGGQSRWLTNSAILTALW